MFYKLIENELHYGPFVQFPTGEFLSVDTMDQFTMPLYDWHYFETIDEANTFFGIVNT